VAQSRAENLQTVVSIFVNPTQFGPNEDFARYPRDEVRDLSLLKDAGVAAVYLPTATDIYPDGYQTYVDVERVSERLEGEARPGHFRGVATVCLKLFNVVEPGRAYLGRKDAQQLRVIQRMVRDLDMPLTIVPCEIVREEDGLARSSRNVYLSSEERAAAPVLYQGLCDAKVAFDAGQRDPDRLRFIVGQTIARRTLAAIEYISLADSDSLEELHEPLDGRAALLSLVVRFGRTRLLDNIELLASED